MAQCVSERYGAIAEVSPFLSPVFPCAFVCLLYVPLLLTQIRGFQPPRCLEVHIPIPPPEGEHVHCVLGCAFCLPLLSLYLYLSRSCLYFVACFWQDKPSATPMFASLMAISRCGRTRGSASGDIRIGSAALVRMSSLMVS